MARYYILDNINLDVNNQTIRLKKVYNIILLDIFPKVLESLIHEYIDDILEVKICKNYGRKISIHNQYVNCDCISLSFNVNYYTLNDCSQYHFTHVEFSNNVAETNIIQDYVLPYAQCGNEYMKLYNESSYFNMYKFAECYYVFGYQSATRHKNTLYYDGLKITINNHRLFKNCLVIIKTILNAFNKKVYNVIVL